MKILGSVRSLQEAQLLLQTPIDLIDLKEPHNGALGALEPEGVRAIVTHVAHTREISAAAGCADEAEIQERARQLSRQGVDFVKIGFSDLRQRSSLPELRAAIHPSVHAIAVLFVDCDGINPHEWIEPARAAGFFGLLLDTANKNSGPLSHHVTPEHARPWVSASREAGLICGLAGRLNAQTARDYLAAAPDYMGFRSALCEHSTRTASIDPDAIRTLLTTLGITKEESASALDMASHFSRKASPDNKPPMRLCPQVR